MKVKRAAPVLFVDPVDATRDFFVRVERHKTFYDSDELTYLEPGCNLVAFAQFA